VFHGNENLPASYLAGSMLSYWIIFGGFIWENDKTSKIRGYHGDMMEIAMCYARIEIG